MSKPFIVSHNGGLRALSGWLSQQSFTSYSYSSVSEEKTLIGLYTGQGRGLTRMAGVLVTKPELFDAAEAAIRKQLGWAPMPASEESAS